MRGVEMKVRDIALKDIHCAAPTSTLSEVAPMMKCHGGQSMARKKGALSGEPGQCPMPQSAGIDCCVPGNNHVMDWGYVSLAETLATLQKASISVPGAGVDSKDAARPAVLELENGSRALAFSFASVTSGVPSEWAAGTRPGVNLLEDLSVDAAISIGGDVRRFKRGGVWNLSRETVKQSPEYTEGSPLSREYEAELDGHHNRQGYWVDEPVAKKHSH